MHKGSNLLLFLLMAVVIVSCADYGDEDRQHEEAKQIVRESSRNQPVMTTLGISDELEITVWNEEELTTSTTIDIDGNIHMILAGTIQADGLTIPELQKEITVRLAKYIKNPILGVQVSSRKSQKVYILGEVQSPGTVTLDSNISLWEAMAQVGGFTADANTERVMLLRREADLVRIAAVNMKFGSLEEPDQPVHNIVLRSRDVVYVFPTQISNIARFMSNVNSIISPLLSLQQGFLLWPDLIDTLGGTNSEATIFIGQ